jgi:hypothetical protein
MNKSRLSKDKWPLAADAAVGDISSDSWTKGGAASAVSIWPVQLFM